MSFPEEQPAHPATSNDYAPVFQTSLCAPVPQDGIKYFEVSTTDESFIEDGRSDDTKTPSDGEADFDQSQTDQYPSDVDLSGEVYLQSQSDQSESDGAEETEDDECVYSRDLMLAVRQTMREPAEDSADDDESTSSADDAPPTPSQDIQPEIMHLVQSGARIRGFVQRTFDTYGFIKWHVDEDGEQVELRIFYHSSQLSLDEEQALQRGDEVEFGVFINERGKPNAQEVVFVQRPEGARRGASDDEMEHEPHDNKMHYGIVIANKDTFGFIWDSDGYKVFFHYSLLSRMEGMPDSDEKCESLAVGTEVAYRIATSRRPSTTQYRALDLRMIPEGSVCDFVQRQQAVVENTTGNNLVVSHSGRRLLCIVPSTHAFRVGDYVSFSPVFDVHRNELVGHRVCRATNVAAAHAREEELRYAKGPDGCSKGFTRARTAGRQKPRQTQQLAKQLHQHPLQQGQQDGAPTEGKSRRRGKKPPGGSSKSARDRKMWIAK